MKIKTILLIPVLIFFLIPFYIFSMDLRDIKEGGNPIITEKGVVFRYKPTDKKAHKVYVSGDFNNWESPIRMFQNIHNVYVCIFDKIGEKGVVLKKGNYRYRFLVDGLWVIDHQNPNYVTDEYGVKLSFFTVKTPIIVVKANPIHIEDNFYIFYYRDDKARSVSLVGDFNFWNPFSLPMHKNGAGLWEITIDIPPGKYVYRFLVDGKYKTDPFGTKVVYDRFSKEMSLVKIIDNKK